MRSNFSGAQNAPQRTGFGKQRVQESIVAAVSVALIWVVPAAHAGTGPYSYDGPLVGVSIDTPSYEDKGGVSGTARITLKTGDGTGSFNCSVRLSRNRKYQSTEYDHAPVKIVSTSPCNAEVQLGAAKLWIADLNISAFKMDNSVSLTSNKARFSFSANGTPMAAEAEGYLAANWDATTSRCLAASIRNVPVTVGSLKYAKGGIELARLGLTVKSAAFERGRPSAVVWVRSANQCSAWTTRSPEAAKFGVR